MGVGQVHDDAHGAVALAVGGADVDGARHGGLPVDDAAFFFNLLRIERGVVFHAERGGGGLDDGVVHVDVELVVGAEGHVRRGYLCDLLNCHNVTLNFKVNILVNDIFSLFCRGRSPTIGIFLPSTTVVGQNIPIFLPSTTVFGRLSRFSCRLPRLSGRTSRFFCRPPRFSGDYPDFLAVHRGKWVKNPDCRLVYHGFWATIPIFAPSTVVDGKKLPIVSRKCKNFSDKSRHFRRKNRGAGEKRGRRGAQMRFSAQLPRPM